jgi:thiamine pyrophosphokinase
MKGCIIIANGKVPRKTDLIFFMSIGYTTLICADGGANSVYKLGMVPDIIIGDLDSIEPDVKKYYSTKTKIVKYSRQNDTDVEKCIKYAVKNKYEKCILLGATGDRLDHTICNLGILLKFQKQINISMMHENSYLQILKGSNVINTIKGETISIYGFDKKTRIRSSGLKYSLKNISLPFGERESTSNMAVKNKVEIKITGGNVFLVRDYKSLKAHGLIS